MVHHHHAAHDHPHPIRTSFSKAFALGIGLNLIFVGVEVTYGIWGNSVALIADAGHNLGDVLGLIVAFAATLLSKRAPTARFTYGLRGSSILAALFNAAFLFVMVGAISWEALQRLAAPSPVAGATVMIVAAVGILVNGLCAWLFASGRESDLNIRGAFLHMASDAVISAGVVVAGLVIFLTGWSWIDPAVSLLVNAVILWGSWGLLRESFGMSMAAVPTAIDPLKVRDFLLSRPGVAALHDLHIWPMSTTEVALTCHLSMPLGHPGDAFLHDLAVRLARDFHIDHPTLQIEVEPHLACALAPDEVL